MDSNVEDEATSSTHFVPRRRPLPQHSSSSSNFRRSNRPHSIGASIISNPKLVKGWQYYDNSPYQKDIKKYFSSVNLGDGGTSAEEIYFELGGGTGTTESGGSGGDYRNSFIQNPRLLPTDTRGGDITTANDPLVPPGIEIKACVAQEEDESCTGMIVKLWSPILGIFLTLVASSCLALASVLKESLSSYQYHPYSVLVWTSQGLFWPSFVLLLCPCQMRSVTLTKPGVTSCSNNKLATIIFLLLRAVLGWVGALLAVESLHHISSENSSMVMWTSPVFVFVIGWLILREKPGWIPIITAFVVILGVGVIFHPPMITGVSPNKSLWVGLLLAASAMISEGVISVLILRHLRHVHFALVTFTYGLVGIGGGLLLYYLDNDKFQIPGSGQDTVLAVIICLLVFLGQTGIAGALKYERAGIFAVISCWQVPMTVVWRYWFLDMTSDWFSCVGTLLILLGVLILVVRKLVESRPRSRRTRRWLGFLLS